MLSYPNDFKTADIKVEINCANLELYYQKKENTMKWFDCNGDKFPIYISFDHSVSISFHIFPPKSIPKIHIILATITLKGAHMKKERKGWGYCTSSHPVVVTFPIKVFCKLIDDSKLDDSFNFTEIKENFKYLTYSSTKIDDEHNNTLFLSFIRVFGYLFILNRFLFKKDIKECYQQYFCNPVSFSLSNFHAALILSLNIESKNYNNAQKIYYNSDFNEDFVKEIIQSLFDQDYVSCEVSSNKAQIFFSQSQKIATDENEDTNDQAKLEIDIKIRKTSINTADSVFNNEEERPKINEISGVEEEEDIQDSNGKENDSDNSREDYSKEDYSKEEEEELKKEKRKQSSKKNKNDDISNSELDKKTKKKTDNTITSSSKSSKKRKKSNETRSSSENNNKPKKKSKKSRNSDYSDESEDEGGNKSEYEYEEYVSESKPNKQRKGKNKKKDEYEESEENVNKKKTNKQRNGKNKKKEDDEESEDESEENVNKKKTNKQRKGKNEKKDEYEESEDESEEYVSGSEKKSKKDDKKSSSRESTQSKGNKQSSSNSSKKSIGKSKRSKSNKPKRKSKNQKGKNSKNTKSKNKEEKLKQEEEEKSEHEEPQIEEEEEENENAKKSENPPPPSPEQKNSSEDSKSFLLAYLCKKENYYELIFPDDLPNQNLPDKNLTKILFDKSLLSEKEDYINANIVSMQQADQHIEIDFGSENNKLVLTVLDEDESKFPIFSKSLLFKKLLHQEDEEENDSKVESTLIDCLINNKLLYAFVRNRITTFNSIAFPFQYELRNTLFLSVDPNLRLIMEIPDQSSNRNSLRITTDDGDNDEYRIVKEKDDIYLIFNPMLMDVMNPILFKTKVAPEFLFKDKKYINVDSIFVYWEYNQSDIDSLNMNRMPRIEVGHSTVLSKFHPYTIRCQSFRNEDQDTVQEINIITVTTVKLQKKVDENDIYILH